MILLTEFTPFHSAFPAFSVAKYIYDEIFGAGPLECLQDVSVAIFAASVQI